MPTEAIFKDRRFAAASALGLAVSLSACGGSHGAGHHRNGGHAGHAHASFADAAAWSARFDDPARDAWQKPDQVVRHLTLSSDSRVADIGAGTGYFVMRIAPQVPVGRVYAVDIEPTMVDFTVKRAQTAGLHNVQGVVASTSSPNLPEPVDVVLLVDTYHHIDARGAYFRSLAESVRSGGRLVIVDYKVDPSISGPPMAMRLSPDAVVEELKAAGWRLQTRSEGFLPRQYLLIFDRAP